MRVHVELPEELDVESYRERHARGEVPDRTPYGLHHMEASDVEVTFRRPATGRRAWAARKVYNRLDGYEALATVIGMPQRRDADVLLTMDERTGMSAALVAPRKPLIFGVGWLERPEMLGPVERRAATTAMRRSEAVFSQSPGIVPVLRSEWGLDPARVHGLTLGIDPEFYTDQPWEDRDVDGLTVTSVGDDRNRDHATLVGAVERVRKEGVPARLELATTLPVEMDPDVGVLHARRMGAAMRGLYARSTVVATALRPNLGGAGLTVVLEGLASGRPVVATDNPGMDSYVEHGRTGLLVPPGDPQAMADAIADLLADPERARAMGAAGRAEVEARFTTAHMAAELREIARSIARR